jgi:hypothetical protein
MNAGSQTELSFERGQVTRQRRINQDRSLRTGVDGNSFLSGPAAAGVMDASLNGPCDLGISDKRYFTDPFPLQNWWHSGPISRGEHKSPLSIEKAQASNCLPEIKGLSLKKLNHTLTLTLFTRATETGERCSLMWACISCFWHRPYGFPRV